MSWFSTPYFHLQDLAEDKTHGGGGRGGGTKYPPVSAREVSRCTGNYKKYKPILSSFRASARLTLPAVINIKKNSPQVNKVETTPTILSLAGYTKYTKRENSQSPMEEAKAPTFPMPDGQ